MENKIQTYKDKYNQSIDRLENTLMEIENRKDNPIVPKWRRDFIKGSNGLNILRKRKEDFEKLNQQILDHPSENQPLMDLFINEYDSKMETLYLIDRYLLGNYQKAPINPKQ
jgi:hypothetical protein